MIDVLLPTLLLFILGYAIDAFVKQNGSAGKFKSELPVHRHALATTSSPWLIERHGLMLSVSTSGMNGVPGQIVDKRSPVVKEALRRAYDLGTALSLVGGLVAVGTAVWATGQVWMAVWEEARSHAAQKQDTVLKVLKRAVEHVSSTSVDSLQPLIPGITLPLSHLPTLLLALVVNQLIHELGHALTAALEDITPSRFSLKVHVVVLSMGVHLPASVDYLPRRAKLRLASSGPFHNLLIYVWLWVLASSGASQVLWQDLGQQGRVVHANSPLAPHISPGRLITHIDDLPVGGDLDIWTDYLMGSQVGDLGRGWCIDKSIFTALVDAPCLPGSGKISLQATNVAPDVNVKCLNPNPILHTPSIKCPCPNSIWLCVRPTEAENILRIRLKDGSYDGQVVIWQGDRRRVQDDIQVGRQGARFLGPVVRWGAMFIQYLSTIALSLFLFNLLPLPHTDGSQILRALLAPSSKATTISLRSSASRLLTDRSSRKSARPMISIRSNVDRSLEDDSDDGIYDYERGRRHGGDKREGSWKKRLRQGIEGGVMILGVGWVAGWAMLTLLRSS